jgi:hypothetical protein
VEDSWNRDLAIVDHLAFGGLQARADANRDTLEHQFHSREAASRSATELPNT